jgi:ribosome-associated protein
LVNADSGKRALFISHLAAEKKAEDIKILDMRKIAYFCDYFVLAGAESFRQATAIADYIIDSLDTLGVKLLHNEGRKEGQWIILDYSDVVVHIFQEKVRRFYDLERLWGDAEKITIKDTI